jgi:hypothetical protein
MASRRIEIARGPGRVRGADQLSPARERRRRYLWTDACAVCNDLELHSSRSWCAHLDINEVMLATTLAPDGYLTV